MLDVLADSPVLTLRQLGVLLFLAAGSRLVPFRHTCGSGKVRP